MSELIIAEKPACWGLATLPRGIQSYLHNATQSRDKQQINEIFLLENIIFVNISSDSNYCNIAIYTIIVLIYIIVSIYNNSNNCNILQSNSKFYPFLHSFNN